MSPKDEAFLNAFEIASAVAVKQDESVILTPNKNPQKREEPTVAENQSTDDIEADFIGPIGDGVYISYTQEIEPDPSEGGKNTLFFFEVWRCSLC